MSFLTVDDCGTKYWRDQNFLHREDGPAIEFANGEKWYYARGILHRRDGPAVEFPPRFGRTCGDKIWLLNGCRHREDGPAVESEQGIKLWFLNGIEVDEPAIVEVQKARFRDAAIALLPLELPPYELLAVLEFAYPMLAIPLYHKASIDLLMGLAASRRKIKANNG